MKIGYIIGLQNDRILSIYGHYGLGCIYIFNDFSRLKKDQKNAKKGLTLAFFLRNIRYDK